jgi:5-methylcytosine-specific restriction protein B
MNTADRSLALVDYALRRRFAFFDLSPGFDHPKFSTFLSGRGIPDNLIAHIQESMKALNTEIIKDADLGRGFCVGHSYFCGLTSEDEVEDAYNRLIDYEVAPLLREYWYEGARAEDWRLRLLKK